MTRAEYVALDPGMRRYNRRLGFLSPTTDLGLLRRLQQMRRDRVVRMLADIKQGLPTYYPMAHVLKRLPAGRLVIDPAPRLREALARFGGAA